MTLLIIRTPSVEIRTKQTLNMITGPQMSDKELEVKLLELAQLEEKFGFLGVSMQVREGVSISLKESIDSVIAFCKRTIKLTERLQVNEDGSVVFAR